MPLGIYHNPGIWFGERQALLESLNKPTVDDIVAEREFDAITISVSRDGLFSFDFSKWPNYSDMPIERRTRQLAIINTYLLTFYCALASRGLWVEDFRRSIPMMRADHNNLLGGPGGFQRGMTSGGLSDDMLRVETRRATLAKSGPIFLIHYVPEIVLKTSFDIFLDLWQLKNESVFTFADLLLGAHVAHFNLRFAEAIALAWLIIEALVGIIWVEYMVSGATEVIDRGKRKTLEPNRRYGIAIKLETLFNLSSSSIIKSHYIGLTEVKDARNDWTHELKPSGGDQSSQAIQLAESLLRDRYNYNATLPPYPGTVLISGGEYVDEFKSTDLVATREIGFNKFPIHTTGLDYELRQALGEHTTGIATGSGIVRVQLRSDAPPEDEQTAKEIVEAHDPAFLTIDNAHRFLPGEYKFDSQKFSPTLLVTEWTRLM